MLDKGINQQFYEFDTKLLKTCVFYAPSSIFMIFIISMPTVNPVQ